MGYNPQVALSKIFLFLPRSITDYFFLDKVSDKEPTFQCKRHKRCRFDPWVRKIPWRRKWYPTPVFLPGKSHEQRSLVGCSPLGHKELDTTEHTCFIYLDLGLDRTLEMFPNPNSTISIFFSLYNYLCIF